MINSSSNIEISENFAARTVTFSVRVQPRASRDEITGIVEGAMRIRLTAPAIENRANEALSEFLADLLKRPKSAVRILSGHHSRTKRVVIEGVTREQVEALLHFEA